MLGFSGPASWGIAPADTDTMPEFIGKEKFFFAVFITFLCEQFQTLSFTAGSGFCASLENFFSFN